MFFFINFLSSKGKHVEGKKTENREIIKNWINLAQFIRWMDEWMEEIHLYGSTFLKTQISIVEEWFLFIFSVNWWKLIFSILCNQTENGPIFRMFFTQYQQSLHFLKHNILGNVKYTTYKFNAIKGVKMKSYFCLRFFVSIFYCLLNKRIIKKNVETYFCIMIFIWQTYLFHKTYNHLQKQK